MVSNVSNINYCMLLLVCCVLIIILYPLYSSAEIKLTLSNAGRESYQPDVYGRHVVVVRKIQKDGSSYKIMSSTGMYSCSTYCLGETFDRDAHIKFSNAKYSDI